jgi:hypothetical protein
MRDAPDMPELEKDHAALGMDGIDDLAPAFDLLGQPDAGYVGIADPARHHGRRLGDDQSARCRALGVIFRVQRPRRVARPRSAHSRQRRHHDAMFEMIRTDRER